MSNTSEPRRDAAYSLTRDAVLRGEPTGEPVLATSPQANPDDPAPLGLYLHVPFCERKCPYCDFNTYAGLENWFDQTVDALCRELATWRGPLAGRTITSVFLGGGTPTVLNAAQLTHLFDAMHSSLRLAADCEITCEANPGTVDRPKFQVLHDLGVNRLSLGVQSFQPAELEFLGRIHSVEDVPAAFDAARAVGFANINLDFMFGLPHQSLDAWQATLDRALALGPEHLSLYSLIVEPNTPLHHWVATGRVDAPDDDLAGEHYEAAMSSLAAAGYVQYEVSNWAKPGQMGDINPDFACRHNLLYWRNQEYVGIGPGAHSHLIEPGPDGTPISHRWSNRKPVPGYVKRMLAGEPEQARATVVDMDEQVSPRASMGETMMLGLRLVREGVAYGRFTARHRKARHGKARHGTMELDGAETGPDLRTVFADELANLTAWGLVTLDDQRVRLSERGLMVGNQVFATFLAAEGAEEDAAS